VIRWRHADGKRFSQVTPAPGGQWWEKGLAKNPIYNRARVAQAQEVVIVEGEKCVHALHDLGIVATTSPGGAKAPEKADWSPLAGKRCILWPDNDEAGIEYIGKVKAILKELLCPLSLVNHEELDLPPKGDVADFVARYGGDYDLAHQAVTDILADAKPIGILGEYFAETEKIIGGERKALAFPWPLLTNLSRALMPGTVTCLFGPPSALKSFLLMECIVEWRSVGIPACAYELEDNAIFHLRRAHAQLARDSRILDNDWVEQNGDAFRESREHFSTELEDVGRAITDAPDQTVSYDMIGTWVENRIKNHEILVIDPVTAVPAGKEMWKADQEFVFHMKSLARRYNKRIILVSHPRKQVKGGALVMDDMAGGSAFQRFTHTVLVLEKNEKEESVTIRRRASYPVESATPRNFMRIAKARNGPGSGKRIAFDFNVKTMRFEEIGQVEK